jgi:hypothetical protein
MRLDRARSYAMLTMGTKHSRTACTCVAVHTGGNLLAQIAFLFYFYDKCTTNSFYIHDKCTDSTDAPRYMCRYANYCNFEYTVALCEFKCTLTLYKDIVLPSGKLLPDAKPTLSTVCKASYDGHGIVIAQTFVVHLH